MPLMADRLGGAARSRLELMMSVNKLVDLCLQSRGFFGELEKDRRSCNKAIRALKDDDFFM
jgi:hypothetical protein